MLESRINENQKSTYMRVLNKIKEHTSIDTISLSVLEHCLIVDDTSVPKCLCFLTNMYNAPNVTAGSMEDVGITCTDLEDLGVLDKIPTH